MTEKTDPLGAVSTYEYDSTDNLTAEIDRNNRRTEFAYDDLNRLTQESWGNIVNYTYDKVGNVLSAIDSFSTLVFAYDNRDRMVSVDNIGTQQSPEVKLAYAYDAAGNLLSLTDTIHGAAGGLNAYSYDALNRLTASCRVAAASVESEPISSTTRLTS